MTYQEFKNKYNEQYIDYDGAYGCQCWDLGQYYFTEVLNVPDSVLSGCGWVGNMVLWDNKYEELLKYFDEVDTHAMQEGDVCIWANPNNEQNCHIAIYDHYNPDDNNCYYFSQNPNPCRVIPVNMDGHHAFRRKGYTPTPVITNNVERNEDYNQIEVLVDNLRVRDFPSLDSSILGFANIGLYNAVNYVESDGYRWCKIADGNFIATSDEWTKDYPKKEDEYIKLKILGKDGNYIKVDSNIYVKV